MDSKNVNELVVWRPGQKVRILNTNSKVEGVITDVCVRMNLTAIYQVEWFSGLDKKEAYFYPCQLEAIQQNRDYLKIGFNLPPN